MRMNLLDREREALKSLLLTFQLLTIDKRATPSCYFSDNEYRYLAQCFGVLNALLHRQTELFL